MAQRKKAAAPKPPKKDAAPKASKKEAAAAQTRDSDIERVRVKKEVPVSASTADAQRMSLEHAKVTIQIAAINDEIGEFMSTRRKKLRDLRKDDLRLANAVNNNTVMRTIECIELRDYKLNQLRYVDPNDETKELLPPVVMPPAMRQKTIFDQPPPGERVDTEEEEEQEEEDDTEDEE